MNRIAPWVFTAVVVLAAALRFPGLELRPMHADEAVHAAKMGQLLEQGRYEYDPREFHGPTLNYLTLVPAMLRGQSNYEGLDEVTLRIVPAVMGVVLVAGHILLVPVLGFRASAIAGLLAALSPAMVYYSRYYIQETLLACFSFGALISICRYLRTPRLAWAILAGSCFGLMHATKETWVIAFVSMAAALLLGLAVERLRGAPNERADRRWRQGRHLLAAIVAAVAISMLFFSSFFTNPGGIRDSVLAYGTYVERASGSTSWHRYPWHHYFGLLLYSPGEGDGFWTEGLIVGLAVIGLVAALGRSTIAGVDRRLLGFLGSYAVLMAALYSAIPYKTPWCVIGFLHGFVLLAGVGAVRLMDAYRGRLARASIAAFVLAAAVHLGWQAWAASYRFEADPRNPYVYAHTSTDVFDIARRVDALSLAHPQGRAMPIEVISRENLWPLPWYLRRFSNVRWQTGSLDGPGNAPVILLTPEMEGELVRKLYELPPPGERELYVSIFDAPVELRPQVEVRGYAAKTLWDGYQLSAPAAVVPAGR
ncbi:MAG: TIGR03663 family protein [Acidobacteria bacterium]|nr:MAG: TIGR03663 family protein [Acidobacteriota bacterium]